MLPRRRLGGVICVVAAFFLASFFRFVFVLGTGAMVCAPLLLSSETAECAGALGDKSRGNVATPTATTVVGAFRTQSMVAAPDVGWVVCVVHIDLICPPIYIQHNQCPC